MKRLRLLFLLPLVLFGCKKDRLKNETESLAGSWEWAYSDHYYGYCNNMTFYKKLNPENSDENYNLIFEKKGKLKFFMNDTLVEESRIVFDYIETTGDQELYVIIKLNNDDDKKIAITTFHNQDSARITKFPFLEILGCEDYNNYFVRE